MTHNNAHTPETDIAKDGETMAEQLAGKRYAMGNTGVGVSLAPDGTAGPGIAKNAPSRNRFEDYPDLAKWMLRLANTNCGMNLYEWNDFCRCLNFALEWTPAMSPVEIDDHCTDCCCARSWEALGISEYTGKSIPEHITELRTALQKAGV